jgi:hypothetical protein
MSYGIRRLAAGAISVLTLLVLASSASARPDTTGWSQLQSAAGHFQVHYPASVSAADAQTVAANLETAYSTEVGSWGFAPPVDDGDGMVDVYIQDTGGNLGEASPDHVGPDSSGYIVIDPTAVGNLETEAHELFHVLQYAIDSRGAKFLKEGTAEWAGANVAGGTSWLLSYWGSPDQPLDCADTTPCATDGMSYARWIFFDYLSEHYGPGIVKQILAQASASNAGNDPAKDLQAIDAVLAAHGTNLTQTFNGFTQANAGGSYSFPGLAGGQSLPHSSASLYTGVTSATLPTQTLTIDHLAANYIYFYSGDARFSSAGCGAATLHLSVDMPAGSTSVPSVSDAFGVHPLTVSGSSATADVPWTNCPGSVTALGIPNPTDADGQQFVVHASLQITPVKQRAGTAPPKIRLSLPKVAKVARRVRVLRFNVHSTGRGTLQVLLHSHYVRGSYRLKAGTNRLRLRLPKSFKGGRHELVLTVYSTTGKRGQTIKRHLRIRLAGKVASHRAPAPHRYAR